MQKNASTVTWESLPRWWYHGGGMCSNTDFRAVQCAQTQAAPSLEHFSLPMSPPPSLFSHLNSHLSYKLQEPFSFSTPSRPRAAFSIKTVLHLFAGSQQCCSLSCRKGSGFSPSHCSIDSIFCFLFSWCFCGTFSWVYNIRMAIC